MDTILLNQNPECRFFFLSQLQQALGEQLTKTTLVHAFASLLKDPEAEVRAAASNRLRGELN